MTRFTDRYALSILGPGDALNADGYKAVAADRVLIDRLLQYATEQHRHTGSTGADTSPAAPLSLGLQTSGGSFGPGERYFYTYTIVDENRAESGPAPYQSIDTPPAVTTPGAPALTIVTGTGSLLPGAYSYVLSAYRGANTQETKAEASSVATIYGINPGSISLRLPDLPAMADGFNVYRKAPSGLHYLYLTTITNPTVGQHWVDDGSIDGDCDRSLAGVNRTSAENAVLVQFPGAAELPAGSSWRIYRTDTVNDWSYSYLIDITPITGATPYTPTEFLDVGLGSQTGGPPPAAQVVNAPPKIRLTNAAEVEGYLPPGRVAVPATVTFNQPGPVLVDTPTFTWVCDHDRAELVSVRPYLGVDSVPDATDVTVDVLLSQAGGTWTSVLTDTVPRVAVGQNIGDVVTFDPPVPLVRGDALTMNVTQNGGGAATDHDLTVNALLVTQFGSVDESYDWLTP